MSFGSRALGDTVMRCALAIAMTAALSLNASAAAAASKKHPRYVRPRAPAAVAPAPSWDFGPARMMPARPYGCVQDEGYGRWTYCGQGRG